MAGKAYLKIVVTVTIIVVLAYKIDWHAVAVSMSKLAWWALPAGILVQLFIFIVGAFRWRLFFKYHKVDYSYFGLLRPYFIGVLFNSILPMSTGGDVLRMYYIHKDGNKTSVAVAPIVTERFIGLLTTLSFASVGCCIIGYSNSVIKMLAFTLSLGLGVLILGFLWIARPKSYQICKKFLNRWSGSKIIESVLQIINGIHFYCRHLSLILSVIIISVVLQCLLVIVFWILGRGLGVDVGFYHYLFVVPLAMLVSGLPVSIGGLGVREATVIMLFTFLGMTQGDATVIAILFIPVLLISSLPGLFFFLTAPNRNAMLSGTSEDLKMGE